MGGKEVDTSQDWSTSTGLSVKISVDFGNTTEYRVYILPTPALYDASATYLGMARMKSGESKTITISRPAHIRQRGSCLLQGILCKGRGQRGGLQW